MRGNIGRRRFLGAAAAGVGAAAMGMAGVARGIGGDEPWENRPNVVWPQGNDFDRDNIDAAIQKYNVVILLPSSGPRQSGRAFNLTNKDPIEIRHDVTIIGKDARIISDDIAFSCSGGAKLSISGVYFQNKAGIIPIENQDLNGESCVNVTQLAIGGDEPWENPVPPS